MRQPKHSSRLDRFGMTASTICAIHCAIVPVLITTLPLIGLGFLANPWVEWTMILLALMLGFSSIAISYFKVHRRPLPIIMLLAGFSVIAAGHLFTAALEAIVVPAGGLTIAAAHFLNNKYGAACQVKGHVHKHA
jgi:hypothetical protein